MEGSDLAICRRLRRSFPVEKMSQIREWGQCISKDFWLHTTESTLASLSQKGIY